MSGVGGGGPPQPPGRAHTRTRTRATHPAPDAGPARRDPPPSRRGEAQAAVGRQRAALCPNTSRRESNPASLATLHAQRRGSGWGLRYPKAPSRIAREGFLTEGASPPPVRPPKRAPPGGAPGPTGLAGRGAGLRQGTGTGQPRALAAGAPSRTPPPPRPRTAWSRHRPEERAPRLPRGGRERGTETGTRPVPGERGSPSGWPSAAALARPAAGAHEPRQVLRVTPPHTTHPPPARRGGGGEERGKGRRGARAPARGTGAPPLPTSSTTRPSDTPTTAAAARGESPGKETTPPLGLRHLRRPGALQGHHGGPGATRSSAPRPGGEQRGVGPALPAEEGRAARHGPRAFGKGRRECPPRPRTPVPPAPRGKKAGGRGRAGVRTTPNPGARPPAHPPRRPGAEEPGREGPAGRTRRAVASAVDARPSSDAA